MNLRRKTVEDILVTTAFRWVCMKFFYRGVVPNCVMLRLRPALRKMNCVSCEIAIFSQSQFAILQIRNFSESVLQPYHSKVKSVSKMPKGHVVIKYA